MVKILSHCLGPDYFVKISLFQRGKNANRQVTQVMVKISVKRQIKLKTIDFVRQAVESVTSAALQTEKKKLAIYSNKKKCVFRFKEIELKSY